MTQKNMRIQTPRKLPHEILQFTVSVSICQCYVLPLVSSASWSDCLLMLPLLLTHITSLTSLLQLLSRISLFPIVCGKVEGKHCAWMVITCTFIVVLKSCIIDPQTHIHTHTHARVRAHAHIHRTAAAIRTAAMTALQALLQSTLLTNQQLDSFMTQLVPKVSLYHSCLHGN